MNIDQFSASVREPLQKFEQRFAETLHSQIPLAEQVVGYISKLKGKRLRPLLVFLSSDLHGTINEKSIGAAIVVELLHTATLVHDDVVDNSATRRGQPTVNHLWDNRISVLVGDLLFSRTLTAVLSLKDPEALAILEETANRITEGELLQIEYDNDYFISEETYLDLISKKTAALFSAACELGAIAVTPDEQARRQMRIFGENLGIAFQIKDDLLDYLGDSQKLGKPVGNDLREKKITLPLIYTLAQADTKTKNKIFAILRKKNITPTHIQSIIRWVEDIGGIKYAQDVAVQYAENANKILNAYPPSQKTDVLKRLVEFSILREN